MTLGPTAPRATSTPSVANLTTYSYTVSALDAAGNESDPSDQVDRRDGRRHPADDADRRGRR